MSMKVDIEIVGLKELVADFKKAGGNADPLTKAALTNSANKVQSEARIRAPHRTGTLQRSILVDRPIALPTATVAVNEKYGVYIEEGTGIYGPKGTRIKPKRAKVLAFKSGGKMVFARSVKGMRKRPFFKPGFDASKSYIKGQFDKVADILLKEIAGR